MNRKNRILHASLTLIGLALFFSPSAAKAVDVHFAFVCDISFEVIATKKGYPSCNDMIREEFVKKGLKFINDNSLANIPTPVYFIPGSWNSPASGSSLGAFLGSLDDLSSWEEQSRWHFIIGFTGRRMGEGAGWSVTKWRQQPNAGVAVVSYILQDNSANTVWASTALHEAGHLLRDDGDLRAAQRHESASERTPPRRTSRNTHARTAHAHR